MTRDQRHDQLSQLLRSAKGVDVIIELYLTKVVGFGRVGQVGLLASQMIPMIVEAEFPSLAASAS